MSVREWATPIRARSASDGLAHPALGATGGVSARASSGKSTGSKLPVAHPALALGARIGIAFSGTVI